MYIAFEIIDIVLVDRALMCCGFLMCRMCAIVTSVTSAGFIQCAEGMYDTLRNGGKTLFS